jgi:hypothetical protein
MRLALTIDMVQYNASAARVTADASCWRTFIMLLLSARLADDAQHPAVRSA